MSEPRLLPYVPFLALLILAAVGDVRTRRIPNWLTFSLVLTGLAQSFGPFGTLSPSNSALGLLVGFGVPFLMFAMGAIGGADVKLLAGIGAWIGAKGAFQVFLLEAVIGLVIVLVQAMSQHRTKVLFRNSAVLAMNLVYMNDVGVEHTMEVGKASRSVDRPLPYAVPVCIAVLVLLLHSMGK
jgi:prepilin peptidase CpaA